MTPVRGQGCYRAAAGSGRSELGKRSSFPLAQRAKAPASPELPCERRPGPAERPAHTPANPRVWETRPSRVSHPLPRVSAAFLARAIRREPNGVLEAPSPAKPQPTEPTPPCVLTLQSAPALPIVPAGASARRRRISEKKPHPSNCAQNAAGRDVPARDHGLRTPGRRTRLSDGNDGCR